MALAASGSGTDLEHFDAAFKVRRSHIDNAVKPARPDQSRVQHILPAHMAALIRAGLAYTYLARSCLLTGDHAEGGQCRYTSRHRL